MKRLLLLLPLVLLLAGCATPDTYLKVEPHAGSSPQATATDAVPAENYGELKKAILGFVERGQTEGAIHVSNYQGSVEDDLTRAIYEVMKLEPLGAYAVDYMTHDCTLIVNYYEIRVEIAFRRTLQEIEAVEPVATQVKLVERLQEAAENYESRVALRIGGYREQDVAAIVLKHCRDHPDTIMETPEIKVSVYPDRGSVRIVELDLHYEHRKEDLEAMETAARESVDAAAEYIRYRESDAEKLDLLYTYLMERFHYVDQESSTPVYDALCRGIASDAGLSSAWKMICDRAGMECYTVRGLKNGEDYTWNILSVDGQYRHLDLAQCVRNKSNLRLTTDSQMSEYYWNQVQYPACVAIVEPQPAPGPESDPENPAEAPAVPAEPAEEPKDEPIDAPAAPEETNP